MKHFHVKHPDYETTVQADTPDQVQAALDRMHQTLPSWTSLEVYVLKGDYHLEECHNERCEIHLSMSEVRND
jgi:hypothetical protein